MTDLQGMNEGRRQRYLVALGIPLWTARHDLPGALPANPLAFVAFVGAGLAETGLAATVSAPAAEPQSASLAVTAPAPVPVQKAALPATPQNDAPPPRTSTVTGDAGFPRFSCRVQPLAPGWNGVIALDDVPDLSAQEHRLLDNLMQALGGDTDMTGARENFRWPMSPNPSIARDAGAAREALAAFLGRRREGPVRWLVLGETLGVYVRAALPQQTVITAPALRELLENPSAKRALWQAVHG
ncbi:MAG: hypothetical protein PSX71_00170 [bacterium]|nr:hypothetical protein [bacterium]